MIPAPTRPSAFNTGKRQTGPRLMVFARKLVRNRNPRLIRTPGQKPKDDLHG
jgi:hypothetical protein